MITANEARTLVEQSREGLFLNKIEEIGNCIKDNAEMGLNEYRFIIDNENQGKMYCEAIKKYGFACKVVEYYEELYAEITW